MQSVADRQRLSGAYAEITSAKAFLGDRWRPSITINSHSVANPEAWTNNPNFAVDWTASDAGLGMNAWGVVRRGLSDADPNLWVGGPATHGCADATPGDRGFRCANGPIRTNPPMPYTLPEGITNLAVRVYEISGGGPYGLATDAAPGSGSTKGQWTARVDLTKPVVVPDIGEDDDFPEDVGGTYDQDGTWAHVSYQATDSLSGIRYVRVRNVATGRVDVTDRGCTLTCAQSGSGGANAYIANLAEGIHEFAISAVDAAGNVSTESAPFRVFVDRTPPPPPTEIRVTAVDPVALQADVAWSPADDPDLNDGGAPSGNDLAQWRSKKVLGNWSPWSTTDEDGATVSGVLPGEPVTLEVRSVDAAGNLGNASSQQLLMVPPLEELAALKPVGGSNTIEVDATFLFADTTTGPRGGMPVVLRSSSGLVYPTATNGDGKATYTEVPDGTYELTMGYGTEKRETVTAGGGERKRYAYQASTGYSYTTAERNFCIATREKALACAHFSDDADIAARFAERLFTQPEGHSDGTKANAFKHSFWVALMVNSLLQGEGMDGEHPEWAIDFAERHESDSSQGDLNNRRESAVDMHNNVVGYNYARAHLPDARGRMHNDTFFCNTVRHLVPRGRRVRFQKGSSSLKPPFRPSQLLWRRTVHPDTRQRVRMFRKDEFSNGEACSLPAE
jgi:hypothetical protein